MRFIAAAAVIILLLGLEITEVSANDDVVRYRTVLFLLPQARSFTTDPLANYLSDFERVDGFPDRVNGPLLDSRVVPDLTANFAVPDTAYLTLFGRGLTSKQVLAVQQAQEMLLIDVAYPPDDTTGYLKTVSNTAYQIASKYNALIWDSVTGEMFSRGQWMKQRLAGWHRDLPMVENHILIRTSVRDGEFRAVTVGMVKFGLPDLVVSGFKREQSPAMASLLNLGAQALLEGLPAKPGRLELNIDELVESPFRARLKESLYKNANKRTVLQFAEGEPQEGDPDNSLLEIGFNHLVGDSLHQRQQAALVSLFGAPDNN